MSGPQGTAWAAQVACTPSAGFNTCVRVTYSGANQTFTVPAGVSSLNLKLWGAAGGNGTSSSGRGGAGSYAAGTLAVSPGSAYTVIVGQGGVSTSTAGTYGGGGAGGTDQSSDPYDGGSGGGRSALRASTASVDLITAGAGGGSAAATSPNAMTGNVSSYAGGGDQDAAYSAGCSAGPAATRGTTTGGGAGGTGGYPGGAGTAYQGGTGGRSTVASTGAGGGGGGGYFGGGAGQGQYLVNTFTCTTPDGNYGQEGGGAGGSSYGSASITGYSSTAANRDVVGNSSDTQYVAGVGAPAAAVTAGTASGNGMVVIQYNRPIRLRVGKSLPSGRAATGDQFSLDIKNGATVLASATTTGATNTPTEQADYTVNTSATYTLSESAAGTANLAYYNSSISCTNATAGSATTLPSGSGSSFTVTPAPGDDISCQITNTPKPATISLQKALGAGGRIAAADQFSLSGTGTGAPAAKVTTGTGSAVASTAYSFTATAGTAYTLNEAMAAGSASTLAQYSQAVSCTNTGPTNVSGLTTLPINVTPAAGDAISCQITNTAKPAIISLQKALGTGGRVAAADQFSLSGTGTGAPAAKVTTGTGSAVTSTAYSFTATPGTAYTLNEAMAAGSASTLAQYSQAVSCTNTGPTNVSGLSTLPINVTPAAGDAISCQITNTGKSPTISLQKVLGGSGRVSSADQFSLSGSGAGAPAATVTTGTGSAVTSSAYSFTATAGTAYTLNEAMAAGSSSTLAQYSQAVSCTNTGPTNVGGINSLPISITPAAGDAISCQITNTPKAATVSLQKVLGTGGRIAAADQFSLSGTGTGAPAAKVTTGTGSAVTSTAYSFTATPGTAYTLNEAMAAGSSSTLAQYGQAVSCTNPGPTSVNGINSLPIGITPTAGDSISCTITNTPKPAPVLTLQKVLGGSGRISSSDQFTLSASGPNAPAAVTTTGGGINVTSAPLSFTATAGGSYTLGEAMASGSASALAAYTQWVSCSNAGGSTSVSGFTTLPISVTPVAGDNISCTITNYAATSSGGVDPGPPPVCNADPVIAGSNFTDASWTRSGWQNNGVSYSGLNGSFLSGTQTQSITGVTPGALLTFGWNTGAASTNGQTASLQVSYGVNGSETVYWTGTATVVSGSTSASSAAGNGAACLSGCGATPVSNQPTVIRLRLPANIPKNGTLKIIGTRTSAAPYIALDSPVSIANTGICLAKTSLGATGTFSYAATGVDTTMGGGGTTASITTAAVNTALYYDASSTRVNNQPLLVTSPGATANVTIGETPAAGFSLESVSCPGLSPVRNGNAISIASVPQDTVTTCTFTNRTPIINLSKALGGSRLGAADNFSVAIRTGGVNGTVVSSTAAATTSGSGATVTAGTGTTGDFYTAPGTTYTLTEAAAGGANLANYKASLTCLDAAGVTPAANLPSNESFNPAIGRDIVAATGANLRCVITNSPDTPTVSGRVFLDNGQGGGTANDGILGGGEGPLAGVAMRLTNCAATVYATAQTDAAGGYSLGVPSSVASGSALCVEETNPGSRVSTGASVGSTALPSGSATSVGGVSYTYTRSGTPDRIAFSWNGTGHANLNFGDVDNSSFAIGSAKTGLPGNTVSYAHTFVAGTAGQVRFSIPGATASPSVSGWTETIFADVGCTGTLQPGAAQLYPPTGAAAAVAFNEQVCIIVREFIPASAPMGASNKVTVRADFDYSNAAPALSASFTLEDVTTVSSVALELKKEVRNVTQGGSFGVNNQAKSGETLEYRVTYTNNSSAPVSSMMVNDTTPGYTSFVSATAGSTPGSLSCTKHTPANQLPAPAVACADAQPEGGTGAIEWKFTGSVAPGASGSVLFRVKVD